MLQIFRGSTPMRYNKGVFGGAKLLKVAAAKYAIHRKKRQRCVTFVIQNTIPKRK